MSFEAYFISFTLNFRNNNQKKKKNLYAALVMFLKPKRGRSNTKKFFKII